MEEYTVVISSTLNFTSVSATVGARTLETVIFTLPRYGCKVLQSACRYLCLSVFLSLRLHISKKRLELSVHVTCGHSLDLLQKSEIQSNLGGHEELFLAKCRLCWCKSIGMKYRGVMEYRGVC